MCWLSPSFKDCIYYFCFCSFPDRRMEIYENGEYIFTNSKICGNGEIIFTNSKIDENDESIFMYFNGLNGLLY